VPKNDKPSTSKDQRRAIIGILAVFFMLGAMAFAIWPPSQGFGLEWEAACWRIGPILAVLWLAYDDFKRVPWWLWLLLPVILIIIVKWPKVILLSLPFLALIALLMPRMKNR
jgi:nicotinamide riboside transporter PnuC